MAKEKKGEVIGTISKGREMALWLKTPEKYFDDAQALVKEESREGKSRDRRTVVQAMRKKASYHHGGERKRKGSVLGKEGSARKERLQ